MHLGNFAYLAHVSSHTCVIRSARVDVFVTEGTSLDATKTQLPLSKSYIKIFL